MSIFTEQKTETIPQCEIVGCVRPCEPKADGNGFKNRCSHCKERYDSKGIAFILYCDIYRYEPIERFKNRVARQDMIFWVCDDVVQKAPRPFEDLLHSPIDDLFLNMAIHQYNLIYKTKAAYK